MRTRTACVNDNRTQPNWCHIDNSKSNRIINQTLWVA